MDRSHLASLLEHVRDGDVSGPAVPAGGGIPRR